MSGAMEFAAILLLCFFPFLIVGSALSGRSFAAGLSRRLGLSHQAAVDVGHLFTSSTATSNAVTGTAYVFFVVGGIAAASEVQSTYERVFELEARGMKNMLHRLAWLAFLIGAALASDAVGPWVNRIGGPVLVSLFGLAVFILFWWFTMWLLLAGRRPWRELIPSAIATGICWLGMEIVFHFILSNDVISNDKKYGPIGDVFALMSWFIAIGVVIVLGAVAGVVWRNRGESKTA